MNAVPSSPNRLLIEVMHDLICPWCYLGIRRLLDAIHQRHDVQFNVQWRPFLLNPDMPRNGMARADYAIRKFGGEDRARRLYASIAEIGKVEGLNFRFERIRRTPSSINAHRLVRWAAQAGRADEMVEALFAAHFSDGLDIGDIGILAAIATSCGLSPVQARAYLSSTDDVDAIHADNLRAHRLGVNGVPCFIIAGKHAIAGAQEAVVIERLLDVAAAEMLIEACHKRTTSQ